MMWRWLAIALLVAIAPALAVDQPLQNYIVPTAPVGTSNNQAASTAFVNGQIAANRIKLTGALSLFSDTSLGINQAGCGLATGAAACNRLNYLFNNVLVPNYDTAGQPVTLNVANNDTGVGLSIGVGWAGGGPVTVMGPIGGCAAPTVALSAAGPAVLVTVTIPSTLTIDCLVLSGQYGIYVASASVVQPARVNFGTATAAHMTAAATGATIVCKGNYTISGGAVLHYQANLGGLINCSGFTVTLTGTPAFGAFADSEGASNVFSSALSFSGSATGQRYFAALNGVINTNGGGPNYFPGNSAGATATGGQYQ